MEITVLELLFENEVYLNVVSKIIDKDKAFLYSLAKLKGCDKFPEALEVKLGIKKKKNK